MSRAVICLFSVLSVVGGAQPRIAEGGVVNSASYLTPGLPNAGIAQGSIFTIYGLGLGPQQLVQAGRLPLPSELAGTSARVVANGRSYPVYLYYTSASAVSGVFPSSVPEGPAAVTVTYGGQESNAVVTQVRKAAFGIFTQNQAGSGPAVMQNWISAQEAPRVNGIRSVVTAAQVGILWGTGLGAISGSDADVPPPGNLAGEVEVLVGGKAARVLYHGRSPTYPGLDQINFEVPETAIGCYVPIAVKAGGVVSNFASISVVTSGTPCGDSIAFRGRLWAGGAFTSVGIVEMIHEEFSYPNLAPAFWSERATARFFNVDWNAINLLPRLGDLQVLPGTCTVSWNRWPDGDHMPDIYPELPGPAVNIDAGDSLKIQGPAGKRILPRASPSEYEGHLGGMTDLGSVPDPRFLNPGTFTFDNQWQAPNVDPPPPAPPLPVTGTLNATVPVSAEIQWLNKPQLTEVDRTQDLTFRWSGGNDAREYVVVGGSSAEESLKTRVTFMCAEVPSAGTLTVPAWILGLLPKNSPSQATAYPYGYLFVGSSSNNVNALSSTQGTLNMLYFRYSFLYRSIVDFR